MKKTSQQLLAVKLLFAGLLFAGHNAKADDGYLVFNTIALHAENRDDRNTLTPGIGWEYSPSGAIGWHIGTLSDSFGYQSTYGGLNFATKPIIYGRVRFLLGATVLHKRFSINSDPETRLVPLPAVEFKLTKRSVLNLSGSPQVDFANQRNNGVLFFQFKLELG